MGEIQINFKFSSATYHVTGLPENKRGEIIEACREKGVTCNDFTSVSGSSSFNMWVKLCKDNLADLKSVIERITEN